MRFNDKDMAVVSQRKAQIEGRLQYRSPPGTFRDAAFRERYFKLINNLLFYFRFNEFGQIEEKEPVGVIILENYSIRIETESDLSFAFGILFLDEPDKRHIFTTRSEEDVNRWVNTLRQASYQHWKNRLAAMQSNIKALKEARDSIVQDKSNPHQRNFLNDVSLLDLGTRRTSPSPGGQRRNPFLPSGAVPTPLASVRLEGSPSPKVPPRTNSPTVKRTKSAQNHNNNNEAPSCNGATSRDLIDF
ncbi:pleckstrin homology domain-containing family J member 1 [Folsomia candida]|uniref:pleckstrin homology domain-containing family J member 1 n=1 Tax=Folsomia candida TaxID=158441 RepID=UPI000B8FA767|nr:pleckstrin homology domain-containing family J member 1 [Folsomia candida]